MYCDFWHIYTKTIFNLSKGHIWFLHQSSDLWMIQNTCYTWPSKYLFFIEIYFSIERTWSTSHFERFQIVKCPIKVIILRFQLSKKHFLTGKSAVFGILNTQQAFHQKYLSYFNICLMYLNVSDSDVYKKVKISELFI